MIEFCDEKKLCVANTWFEKEKQSKITYSTGENTTVNNSVLVGKSNKVFKRGEISRDSQHRLVVTDLDKRKLKEVVKNRQPVTRKVWKFQDNNTKSRFQERVKEMIKVEAPNIWKPLKIVF